MQEKVLKILNEEGMHARPAGVLAKLAGSFSSTIEIVANDKTINAKSKYLLLLLMQYNNKP